MEKVSPKVRLSEGYLDEYSVKQSIDEYKNRR